ncbi:phosphoribosylformylglycinamidine synthase subunit PurL [Streptomyces tanashiensis]
MGARPVAVVDPLRFGAADHPDTKRVLPGVVARIGGYGNCLGLPNIGGEVVFDSCYQGNPLVNAGCIGAMKHEDIHLAKASGPGNKVILYGARTGGDGISAASRSSRPRPSTTPSPPSAPPSRSATPSRRSSHRVHPGDLQGEARRGHPGPRRRRALLRHVRAGLRGLRRQHVDLEKVHLRDATLSPEEILMSESQERMCAIVRPAAQHVDRFLEICEKWDVIATVIGEVTEGERLEIFWHGEQIVDVLRRAPSPTRADLPPAVRAPGLAGRAPGRLRREAAPAAGRRRAEGPGPEARLLPEPGLEVLELTDQYDRFVQGNTVLAQPEDAGMVRIDEETNLGVAMATDGNGRYAKLDPYTGAQLALAEAYRNVAASGAKPLAISDCLNFGSPEDPAVMWQFAEATRGLADGCLQLGTPVTGGNVSLYNQTGEVAIHPTPVVAVLGVIDDVNRRTPIAFAEEGQLLYLLGDTKEEFGGSAWSAAPTSTSAACRRPWTSTGRSCSARS